MLSTERLILGENTEVLGKFVAESRPVFERRAKCPQVERREEVCSVRGRAVTTAGIADRETGDSESLELSPGAWSRGRGEIPDQRLRGGERAGLGGR